MAGFPVDFLERDVLFIRLRLLGDIVFTIPAIRLFKNRHPSSRLHYVVEERFREIAGLIPGVDHVLTVPRRRGPREILSFRRAVKDLGIRAVVDFHSGPGSAVLTRASGAPQRVGYRTPNRNWAYTRRVERHLPGAPVHSVLNQVRLLEPLGIEGEDAPGYPAIEFRPVDLSPRIAAIMGLHPKVVVHLGAGNRFRDWGEENFAALVGRLGAQGIPALLIGGGSEEVARAARLAELPHAHDLSGPIPVRELLALVDASSAYVGADSGPLHLASLTATPLVALYGPNLAEVSGPWRGERVEVLQLEMPCRPCSQRGCKYGTIPCMRNISVEKVHEAVAKFIA
ncbi:MAG: glycosyltransferase family 9 protein [Candidatus Aminicenantes bacterium]|nr:glycosyltransferase family 9 protein [Candidatus Aminicenantes bacterium]